MVQLPYTISDSSFSVDWRQTKLDHRHRHLPVRKGDGAPSHRHHAPLTCRIFNRKTRTIFYNVIKSNRYENSYLPSMAD